jgi:hypothetical protein
VLRLEQFKSNFPSRKCLIPPSAAAAAATAAAAAASSAERLDLTALLTTALAITLQAAIAAAKLYSNLQNYAIKTSNR